MNLSRYWPLAILLLGLAGCSGTSPAATSGGKSAAQWIESGNAALARGETDRALDYFSSALEAQSDSALAHERRAAAFLQMKKFDQSVNDCKEALKIDGKLASAYFTQGLAEEKLGDIERALDDLTRALDNGLERADVLTARGGLYHTLAKAKASVKPDEAAEFLKKAFKDFEQAVKLEPRQVEPRMQRAAICLDMRDYEGAVADCDAVLEADPNLAAAHVARARAESELSETDKAVIDCDSAIHLDENLIEAYAVRAKARLEKSAEMRTLAEVAQCNRAVDDCQKVLGLSKRVESDTEDGKQARSLGGLAHELRGSIYHNLHAAKKALAEYEQALSLDPFLVSALLRRAVTRSVADDYSGALNDCNTAIGIDSARPEAYSGRGWVYGIKQDYPKALDDFRQAVSLDRKCAKAYHGRALVYFAMAAQELGRALELRKANRPSDRPEIISCMEKVKDFRQKCISDTTAAIDANRHMARAYLTRGLAYGSQANPEKALVDFTAAIREDPKMVRAYYNLGILYAKRHDLKAAIWAFDEAGKLQPTAAVIDRNLFLIYQEMGDPIMTPKYYNSWQKKLATARTNEEEFLESAVELTFRPKKLSELQPDIDVDPLDKAKQDLEKKLDETAKK